MRYAGYPENQDSNIEWIGRIPAHWSMHRLKWSVLDCTNGVWGEEADGVDDIVCLRVADFDRDKFTITQDNLTIRAVEPKQLESRKLKKGDLLIEKSGGGEKQLVGCVVYFDHDFDAVSSNFVARMTVDPALSARYICYLHAGLYAGKLNYPAIKQTTGIQNLDTNEYLNTLVAYPPTVEQEQIAAFLDWKTGQIDALIAKKKELLEKLKEKRLAVITQAVTKGLPSTGSGQASAATMKDSGIPWLGQVPEHWSLNYKLGFLAASEKNSFVNGPFGSDLLTTELVDEGIPVLYSGDVKATRFSRKSGKYVTEEKALELDFCRVEAGDVLLAKVGDPPGDACVYPMGSEPAIVTQDVVRIRVDRDAVDSEFMSYLLVSVMGRYLVRLVSVEATRGRFSLADLKSIRFPIPPLAEQQKIAKHLSSVLARIDKMGETNELAVASLTEYRTALITAATTGKIDVRQVAVPSPAQTSGQSMPLSGTIKK